MKAFVLLFLLLVFCNVCVYYYYDPKVVEDYSNHFSDLDSITQAEEKALYILDSIEELRLDSIYSNL